ncbi:vesicle-associated membrane protein 8-like [Megalops cyprinoides]|uniref:vesicle-associated membrane protein 8-like n=1 Tax=Megalops cyprinoides TaxID=118141 RepID=UPI001864EEA7|nr:vesicle-associated membrane protein 8-like [Megalops cyprinoides]
MEYNAEKGKKSDKLESMHADIEEVKGIMTENINRLVDRGEALDRLRCRTEDLDVRADGFRRTARNMAWSACLRDKKLVAVALVITLLVILIIVLLAVGVIPVRPSPKPNPSPIPSTSPSPRP